jgi:hypothetical protein
MQNTLKKEIKISGIDLVSGNPSKVILSPACEGTGIVFRTPREEIKSTLDNAYAMTFPCKTVVLCGERDRVAVVEHISAQLYAYEIDNAYVRIDKTPSLSSTIFRNFGNARNMQFVPDFGECLCRILEENVQRQDKARETLTIEGYLFR